jgi:Zn ribbon nucleic-acid-binding protein
MKIKCVKCGQRMTRTPTSIKKSAQLQGITPEEYIQNYVCQNCQKRERLETAPEPPPANDNTPKTKRLVIAKRCQSCTNKCKVYIISEKAVLNCPRYHRRLVQSGDDVKSSATAQEQGGPA